MRIIDILTDPHSTLFAKPTYFINTRIFVPSSKEMNVIWIFDFECHKQADSFKRIETFINIIPQEDILECFHLSFIRIIEILKKS